jgi:hypothetical protein
VILEPVGAVMKAKDNGELAFILRDVEVRVILRGMLLTFPKDQDTWTPLLKQLGCI